MVISVKDAIAARAEGVDVTELCEDIDNFLMTADAADSVFCVGDINDYAKRQITKLYTEAGWTVAWSTNRDAETCVRMVPDEDQL